MKQSKIETIELEVELEWNESADGTKEYLDATCQTKVPISVSAWACHEAWMALNRRGK